MKQTENTNYWDNRAKDIKENDLVTHSDLYQKKLELELIYPHLRPDMNVLEVGCGNGYVTEFLCKHVSHVDSFDASKEMISLAKKKLSGNNCTFFMKSLPNPSQEGLKLYYDAVLSVRVLINLPNKAAQSDAIDWIASKLRKGGLFLLLEGSKDGLEELNKLRLSAGLNAIKEPSFNLNLRKSWLEKTTSKHFELASKNTIGVYDFLTRFFYPLLVGEDNVQYNTSFHKAALDASKVAPNDGSIFSLSRLHVYAFIKR